MPIQKVTATPYLILQHTTLLLLRTTQPAFTPQFTTMLLLTQLQFIMLPFTMLQPTKLLSIMPQLTKSQPTKLQFTNTDTLQLMIILE